MVLAHRSAVRDVDRVLLGAAVSRSHRILRLLGGLVLGQERIAHHVGQLDGLHHDADDAVDQDHHGIAILLGVVPGMVGHVDRFLHGLGREHQQLVAAVAVRLGCLPVVLLRTGDRADAGAAAHDRADDNRKMIAGRLGDALRLQRDAAGGRGGHRTRAAKGGAVDHIDGGDFGFALQEDAANLRHSSGEILGNFILGSDRVTGKEAASASDGSFSNRFAALHEPLFHDASSFCYL